MADIVDYLKPEGLNVHIGDVLEVRLNAEVIGWVGDALTLEVASLTTAEVYYKGVKIGCAD